MPAYEPFDPEDDPSTLPDKWDVWVHGLENLFEAMAITDHKRRRAMLLMYGGAKMRTTERQLEYKAELYGTAPNQTENHYERLKEAFTKHFAPSKNATYACYELQKIVQEESEDILTFVTRLRKQAKLWVLQQSLHGS